MLSYVHVSVSPLSPATHTDTDNVSFFSNQECDGLLFALTMPLLSKSFMLSLFRHIFGFPHVSVSSSFLPFFLSQITKQEVVMVSRSGRLDGKTGRETSVNAQEVVNKCWQLSPKQTTVRSWATPKLPKFITCHFLIGSGWLSQARREKVGTLRALVIRCEVGWNKRAQLTPQHK